MKLTLKDIRFSQKDRPCVVALHGPSLNEVRDDIERLQKKDKIIRLSVNEWFDFFSSKPDYWIVSNSEFTIKGSILGDHIWQMRNYPPDVFNRNDIPLLYNITADLTEEEFIEENLNCDYLPYDTRHFKQHTCLQILQNFKKYYEENKNLNFKFYGNNSQMWQFPNVESLSNMQKAIHGKVADGWSKNGKCCESVGDSTITIQEELQYLSGHKQHMGTGQTVGIFAVILAVIMGCNPVYVTGMDLNYSLGYARADFKNYHVPNAGNLGFWSQIYKDFLLDDMRILNESAKLLGTKIINLNQNSWYDVFEKGDINE